MKQLQVHFGQPRKVIRISMDAFALLLLPQTQLKDAPQDTLGKDVVKIGFPPAKKLGWVSMEKGITGEQMLMCKVGCQRDFTLVTSWHEQTRSFHVRASCSFLHAGS